MELLINKIKLNEEKIEEEIFLIGYEKLTPSFFCGSWINSFSSENYKKQKKYQPFIKKQKISSLEQMANIVKTLLKDVNPIFLWTILVILLKI